MPERDYVDQDFKVSFTGLFDSERLYQQLYAWFKKHGFTWKEVDYKDVKEGGTRKVMIKWQADKPANDYILYRIETDLVLSGLADVLVGKKKKSQGTVSLKFVAYLVADYEDEWKKGALLKFLREVYDKFVMGSRHAQFKNDLKEEVRNLVDEIKTYLQLTKVGNTN